MELNFLETLELELRDWLESEERQEQLTGYNYYRGKQEISNKQRTVINERGELEVVKNLPNSRDIDNQYQIAVNKKCNYFLGKPISFISEDKQFSQQLSSINTKSLQNAIKRLSKKSMNGGKGFLYIYLDENNEIRFRTFDAHEILVKWKDDEHIDIEYACRFYEKTKYIGTTKTKIKKVDLFTEDGVQTYILKDNGKLQAEDKIKSYIQINDNSYKFNGIPLICFKYNDAEIPLIRNVKNLQDAYNEMLSLLHDNLLEDSRSTILVIHNYGAENLGSFRKNLSQYAAIKVTGFDGITGDVKTLKIEVNTENFKTIIQLLKNAIVENAKSFDGKMLQSGSPNQMNILSMYQDIDIDTNEFESEFRQSLYSTIEYIKVLLLATNKGNFENSECEIIFNRDMLMNESEIMDTLIKCGVRISNYDLLSQVPFINDVEASEERLKEQDNLMLE